MSWIQRVDRSQVGALLTLTAIGTSHWFLARALRNDAFVDEATYIVSGQLLREAAATGAVAPPIATYLSGAPHLYPMLASALFAHGGLELVRALSLVSMLIALVGIFASARLLFANRLAGVMAAAVFAVQAPSLFLARFATYDAPCVALLALALAFALDRNERRAFNSAALAGACIGAAAVIKYAALLYVPCIVLVAGLVMSGSDRWKRAATTALSAGAIGATLIAFGHPMELWTGFMTTTLSRSVTSGGQTMALLLFAMSLGGAVALMALPGLALAPAAMRGVAVVIFVSGLLAPLNHLRLHEFVSLHKHIDFALVLFATLAGGSLASLARWSVRQWQHGQVVVAIAVVGAALAIGSRAVLRPGIDEAERLFRYWPDNTKQAYESLAPIASSSAHFLSEEPDLGTLYLGQRAPATRWAHPYYFDYDGQQARKPTDLEPYRHAIRDGYFTAVLLRFGPQRTWADAVEEALLRSQPRYRLAARFPFELADGAGAYQVWVRSDAPGADRVH